MVVIVLLLTISAAGAAPNRGLAVPNDTLPAELKGVPVQDSYTGSGASAVGEIQSVVGHVVVFREDKQYAYFAAPKDKLFERDIIYTLKASRCRFQLYSSDTATMAENTRILIKTYLNNRNTGVKSTSFVMKKGKAMFYALRLFMYKGSSMEVETPTAVSGVRGTKWGVEVVEGKESASLPILVADASDLGGFRQLAQANPCGSGGDYTIIHSFEGSVTVTGLTGQSAILPGGMSIIAGTAGLCEPYPTPPGTFQELQGGGESVGGGSGYGSLGSRPISPDTSSIIQDQNQRLQLRPTTRFGYYVGMLTTITSGAPPSYLYSTTQMSNTPAEDLASIDFANKFQPSSVTPTVWQETGYNAYLTWGYWTQSTPWGTSAPYYAFINKGYYVAGDVTAVMPASISGTYSGDASGTVWTDVGSANYHGPFSMNVTFAGGAGSVSNFNLSMGDPASAGVSIINGAGAISNTGSFTVSAVDANVTINGSTPVTGNSATAKGSFYGPTGQMVGGVWQAYTVTNSAHANGNFWGIKP